MCGEIFLPDEAKRVSSLFHERPGRHYSYASPNLWYNSKGIDTLSRLCYLYSRKFDCAPQKRGILSTLLQAQFLLHPSLEPLQLLSTLLVPFVGLLRLILAKRIGHTWIGAPAGGILASKRDQRDLGLCMCAFAQKPMLYQKRMLFTTR